MFERLGLRIRFALFFLAMAVGGSALFAGGLYLGDLHAGGPVEGYVSAWLFGSIGLLGITAWVGFLFDENVARPIRALALTGPSHVPTSQWPRVWVSSAVVRSMPRWLCSARR